MLLLTLLVAACGPDTRNASNHQGSPGVGPQQVVIGTDTDLSGNYELQGADSIDGARLRFNEANQSGGVHGRHIRLIVDDSGSKVPNAVSQVHNLIHQNRVFAMFLSLGIQTDNAALAEETKNKVPNMFPLSGTRSMVYPESNLKFSARPTYGDEIRAGISYFVGQKGKQKPCIVYDDTGYGHEVLQAARQQLKTMKKQLTLAMGRPVGQTDDDDGVIDKLQAASCDLVLLGTNRTDSIALLKAAKRNQAKGEVFVGTDVDYGEKFADDPDASADGLYAITPMARLYKQDQLSPKLRLWWNKYFVQYGDQPRLRAMEGYRDADLMVKALDAAGPHLSRASFIKAMEGIKDYTGPFGYHLSFGPDKHQGTKASVLSVLQHGKWKVVEKTIRP